MTEPKDSCVQAAKGPIRQKEGTEPFMSPASPQQEATKMIARVGKPAPDFEASAYLQGGFKNIRLSEFKGKWVVLCFYPGDFTFV